MPLNLSPSPLRPPGLPSMSLPEALSQVPRKLLSETECQNRRNQKHKMSVGKGILSSEGIFVEHPSGFCKAQKEQEGLNSIGTKRATTRVPGDPCGRPQRNQYYGVGVEFGIASAKMRVRKSVRSDWVMGRGRA